jgi:hypothetical protein
MFPGDDIGRLIPENVRSVLDDLRKKPIDYLKWLYANPNPNIYQGDILEKITVYSLDQNGAVSAREGPAIVVSQTCDCQPDQGEYLLVAPIFLDLRQIFSISSEYFHSEPFEESRRRLTGLSQKGHYFFLMRLGYFLCRPDPIDSQRAQ